MHFYCYFWIMNLEKHISTLLYHHDCVVIPEFGAFVGRRVNSVYQPETSVFSPPSKQLMFNPSLYKNDGILVQQIAIAEGLDFDSAREEIDSAVRFWKNHLSVNSRLTLQGLGSLTKDSNGSLSFEPEHPNFLLESYGLEDIHTKYILQKEEKKSSSAVLWKTAALIPVLIGGFLYFGKPQPVADFVNQQWSGFVSPMMNPNLKAAKATETAVNKVVEDTYVYAEKIEAKKVIHNYQVIAGSFKKMNEVDIMVESLHQKGFEQARYTQKKGSFYYVALQTFPTKDQAQEYVNKINNEIPGVWILSLND